MRLGYKIWMVSLCFSHMIYKSNASQGWQYLVPVVPRSLAGTRIQQKIFECREYRKNREIPAKQYLPSI